MIGWGWQKDDHDADRVKSRDLDVMEAVLRLPNPACKESAIHGLGHMVRHSDRAHAILGRFLAEDAAAELERHARSALTGCIQ